jgi:hypothetical protein
VQGRVRNGPVFASAKRIISNIKKLFAGNIKRPVPITGLFILNSLY